MIPDEEPFVYAKPRKPRVIDHELEKELDKLSWRPLGYEW
jgi:hypothetical protein